MQDGEMSYSGPNSRTLKHQSALRGHSKNTRHFKGEGVDKVFFDLFYDIVNRNSCQ
jgi:hypothetical protein